MLFVYSHIIQKKLSMNHSLGCIIGSGDGLNCGVIN